MARLLLRKGKEMKIIDKLADALAERISRQYKDNVSTTAPKDVKVVQCTLQKLHALQNLSTTNDFVLISLNREEKRIDVIYENLDEVVDAIRCNATLREKITDLTIDLNK